MGFRLIDFLFSLFFPEQSDCVKKKHGYWQRLNGVYFSISLSDGMQYIEFLTARCRFLFTVFPIRVNYDSPSKSNPDNIDWSLIASQ